MSTSRRGFRPRPAARSSSSSSSSGFDSGSDEDDGEEDYRDDEEDNRDKDVKKDSGRDGRRVARRAVKSSSIEKKEAPWPEDWPVGRSDTTRLQPMLRPGPTVKGCSGSDIYLSKQRGSRGGGGSGATKHLVVLPGLLSLRRGVGKLSSSVPPPSPSPPKVPPRATSSHGIAGRKDNKGTEEDTGGEDDRNDGGIRKGKGAAGKAPPVLLGRLRGVTTERPILSLGGPCQDDEGESSREEVVLTGTRVSTSTKFLVLTCQPKRGKVVCKHVFDEALVFGGAQRALVSKGYDAERDDAQGEEEQVNVGGKAVAAASPSPWNHYGASSRAADTCGASWQKGRRYSSASSPAPIRRKKDGICVVKNSKTPPKNKAVVVKSLRGRKDNDSESEGSDGAEMHPNDEDSDSDSDGEFRISVSRLGRASTVADEAPSPRRSRPSRAATQKTVRYEEGQEDDGDDDSGDDEEKDDNEDDENGKDDKESTSSSSSLDGEDELMTKHGRKGSQGIKATGTEPVHRRRRIDTTGKKTTPAKAKLPHSSPTKSQLQTERRQSPRAKKPEGGGDLDDKSKGDASVDGQDQTIRGKRTTLQRRRSAAKQQSQTQRHQDEISVNTTSEEEEEEDPLAAESPPKGAASEDEALSDSEKDDDEDYQSSPRSAPKRRKRRSALNKSADTDTVVDKNSRAARKRKAEQKEAAKVADGRKPTRASPRALARAPSRGRSRTGRQQVSVLAQLEEDEEERSENDSIDDTDEDDGSYTEPTKAVPASRRRKTAGGGDRSGKRTRLAVDGGQKKNAARRPRKRSATPSVLGTPSPRVSTTESPVKGGHPSSSGRRRRRGRNSATPKKRKSSPAVLDLTNDDEFSFLS